MFIFEYNGLGVFLDFEWGTRMTRRGRWAAGACLLVKCPDTSRRSCRRKRNGKGGTCRIWPECRCIRAAGGIRICLVRQILPSLPVPFSSTASNRSLYGLFTSRHCPASSRTHLVIRCCIQTVVKSSFPGEVPYGSSGWDRTGDSFLLV